MSKPLVICLFTILLVFGFSRESLTLQAHQSEIDDEEYSVYAFLIGDSEFSIIKDHTVIADGFPLGEIKAKVPTISQETLDDFRLKYSKTAVLNHKLKVKGEYLLISKEELSRIFSGNDLRKEWEQFDKKYPSAHGFTSFSRVGFNAQGTEALVYTEYECGWLCANGEYLFLVKDGSKWKIMARIQMWVS